MDQFTNQQIIQQHYFPSMPLHSPNYNFFPQQQPFSAEIGHVRPELGYNQNNQFPRPDFYLSLPPGTFPDSRPAPYPQDMHQAAIQRDMEKQRIRDEIMHDMARRRELEEEVRRELRMEAELALQKGNPFGISPVTGFNSSTNGFAITESPLEKNRIALSVEERMTRENKGVETMPFQRGKGANLRVSEAESILERGKEKNKIILLAKPDTNTSGSKRKSETPQPVLILKKKGREEWPCALCQIIATSQHGLNEHLQGKKHRSKEAASRTNCTGKNYVIGLLSNKTTQSTQVASEPLKKNPEVTAKVQKNAGEEERKYRHWCEVCHVGTHSKIVMKNHIDGKTHLKGMSKNLLKVETVVIDAEDVDELKDVISEETLDVAGSEHH